MKKLLTAITLLSFTAIGSAVAVIERPALVNVHVFFPYLAGFEKGVTAKITQYGLFDSSRDKSDNFETPRALSQAGKTAQDFFQQKLLLIFSKAPIVQTHNNSDTAYEAGSPNRSLQVDSPPVHVINPFLDRKLYIIIQPYFDAKIRGHNISRSQHFNQSSS